MILALGVSGKGFYRILAIYRYVRMGFTEEKEYVQRK
jgi:hypothetical protein